MNNKDNESLEMFGIILSRFLKTMASDLHRRAFDESGEQQEETKGREDTLRQLIKKTDSLLDLIEGEK
jgi:hypothetical protein